MENVALGGVLAWAVAGEVVVAALPVQLCRYRLQTLAEILKLSFRLQKFFFFALFTAAQLLTPCCGKGYRYSRFKAMQNIYLDQSLRVAYISGVSTSTILTNIQLGTSY